MDSENIAPGLLESQSIIKEMRRGSSLPRELRKRDEKEQTTEMKAKRNKSLALEMADFRLDNHGLM